MLEAGFESLDAGTEERTSLETFLNNCKADPMLLGWIITGDEFWVFECDPPTKRLNVVEEEQIHSTKSSHGSVSAEIDVNFIFRHPRYGDGGIGAVSEKCRCCFLYRNAVEIENLYPKEEAGVVGGDPVCVPPYKRHQPSSRFNAKVPGEEQYVVNASFSIFPRFSAL